MFINVEKPTEYSKMPIEELEMRGRVFADSREVVLTKHSLSPVWIESWAPFQFQTVK